jgi:hypothetical protein
MALPKPSADEAFAAASQLRAVVQQKQRTLTLYETKFPDPNRIPAQIKYESEQLATELALLTPTLLYLEEIAGRGEAPTRS